MPYVAVSAVPFKTEASARSTPGGPPPPMQIHFCFAFFLIRELNPKALQGKKSPETVPFCYIQSFWLFAN